MSSINVQHLEVGTVAWVPTAADDAPARITDLSEVIEAQGLGLVTSCEVSAGGNWVVLRSGGDGSYVIHLARPIAGQEYTNAA